MRRHKYNAKRTECSQGHSHPSRREAMRCNDLHLLQAVGQITNLEVEKQFYFCINGRQVKMDNGRRSGIKVDFAYVENGVPVVEDAKGYRVRDFPLRKAVFCALYPDYDFREV